MENFLLTPPFAAGIFLMLAYGLYKLSGAVAAKGDAQPGKYKPYASGEDLAPSDARLSYHAFFRLALLFGVLHVAGLVLSTLPLGTAYNRLALLYLGVVGLSILVLTTGDF